MKEAAQGDEKRKKRVIVCVAELVFAGLLLLVANRARVGESVINFSSFVVSLFAYGEEC